MADGDDIGATIHEARVVEFHSAVVFCEAIPQTNIGSRQLPTEVGVAFGLDELTGVGISDENHRTNITNSEMFVKSHLA